MSPDPLASTNLPPSPGICRCAPPYWALDAFVWQNQTVLFVNSESVFPPTKQNLKSKNTTHVLINTISSRNLIP